MAAVISPVSGTRTEPKDSYAFVRGTTAVFKIIFMNNDLPVTADTMTIPVARILQPKFLNDSASPVPVVLASLQGSLVPGQQFEYQFTWDIPANLTPLDEYIISYEAVLGGQSLNFGDEYFTVGAAAGQIGIKSPVYATVNDVRKKKFNIDDYMPPSTRADVNARNNIIEDHLKDASNRLREELNMSKARGNSENYRLFCIYYAIYTILLAARGEDGSSVSDQNILFWRGEADRILAQEKRKSVMQGVPLGRG